MGSTFGPPKISLETPKNAISLPVIIFILILFILGGGGIALYQKKFAKRDSGLQRVVPEISVAHIKKIEGKVFVSYKGQEYREAKEGDPVFEKTKLKTLPGARAIIIFDTGDILRIDGETEIEISKITEDLAIIENYGGQIYVKVVAGSKRSFKINSKESSAIASEKTAFDVYYHGSAALVDYWVFEGQITLGDGTKVSAGQWARVDLNTENPPSVSQFSTSDLNDFIKWNLGLDGENNSEYSGSQSPSGASPSASPQGEGSSGETVIGETTPSPTPTNAGQNSSQGGEIVTSVITKIILTGYALEGGRVYLNWSADGIAKKGFKVVWSRNPNPTYPADQTGNKLTKLEPGVTYYFRVCEYLGGEQCGTYSNEIPIEAK